MLFFIYEKKYFHKEIAYQLMWYLHAFFSLFLFTYYFEFFIFS